jgi:hypothetical protein
VTKVPPKYYNLLEVFSREDLNKLPERRAYDYKIKLKEGKQHGFSPLYGIS